MTDIIEEGIKKPSAVALGFFDGLHLGHIEVIKRTLLIDGLSPVVFTFNDKTVLPKFKEKKGHSIITHEQKTEIFEKIGAEYIYAPDFNDVKDYSAREFVELILKDKLSAALVVCGYDFRFGKGGEGNPETLKALCAEYDIKCEIVPAVTVDGETVSSTVIREKIRNGEIETANRYLGYELCYTLPVIKGKQIGRTIGFPTINQKIPDYMVKPKNGVYKSWTIVDGKTYRSVTNIGIKPTVDYDGEAIMETHIIGFNGDLYDKSIRVALRGYIRGEEKFSGLNELKERISVDKTCALS